MAKALRGINGFIVDFPMAQTRREKKSTIPFNTCYLEPGKEDATTTLCSSLNVDQMLVFVLISMYARGSFSDVG